VSRAPKEIVAAVDNAFLAKIREKAGDAAEVLRVTIDHFGAETGTIHRLKPDGLLHLEAKSGNIPAELLPMIQKIPVGKGIAGLAVERKAPVDLCNLQTDNSGAARPGARQTGVKGSICVPILAGGRAVGALGIGTGEERQFRDDETQLLLAVGRILGDASP
jgi:GAF domain-containing protein